MGKTCATEEDSGANVCSRGTLAKWAVEIILGEELDDSYPDQIRLTPIRRMGYEMMSADIYVRDMRLIFVRKLQENDEYDDILFYCSDYPIPLEVRDQSAYQTFAQLIRNELPNLRFPKG